MGARGDKDRSGGPAASEDDDDGAPDQVVWRGKRLRLSRSLSSSLPADKSESFIDPCLNTLALPAMRAVSGTSSPPVPGRKEQIFCFQRMPILRKGFLVLTVLLFAVGFKNLDGPFLFDEQWSETRPDGGGLLGDGLCRLLIRRMRGRRCRLAD